MKTFMTGRERRVHNKRVYGRILGSLAAAAMWRDIALRPGREAPLNDLLYAELCVNQAIGWTSRLVGHR